MDPKEIKPVTIGVLLGSTNETVAVQFVFPEPLDLQSDEPLESFRFVLDSSMTEQLYRSLGEALLRLGVL